MHNSSDAHGADAGTLVTSLWRHRELTSQLIRQEIAGRYRGSVFGVAWSVITPVLMLLIYTFVFSVIFGARWQNVEGEGRGAFAVVLFAGMAMFGLFSDVVVRAPNLIVSNANYVKRVVFPLEVLPVVQAGVALFHFVVAMSVWFAAALVVLGAIPWTAVLIPLVVAPLLLATLGVAWALASLGVFLRDLGQSIGLLVTALLFLTPIFYPAEAIPAGYRALLYINPLAGIIEQARGLLVFGRLPPAGAVLGTWAASAAVAMIGFAWFQKTRKGFADVL